MKRIKLTKGKYAVVDDENFEYLNQHKWYLSSRGYAIRETMKDRKVTKIYMHRVVNNTPTGLLTDHINRNQLDNRKENLRNCNATQNCQNRKRYKNNTSGFKGVSFNKENGKWVSNIRVNGKLMYLGYFKTPEEAGRTYCQAGQDYFGDFYWKGT